MMGMRDEGEGEGEGEGDELIQGPSSRHLP